MSQGTVLGWILGVLLLIVFVVISRELMHTSFYRLERILFSESTMNADRVSIYLLSQLKVSVRLIWAYLILVLHAKH